MTATTCLGFDGFEHPWINPLRWVGAIASTRMSQYLEQNDLHAVQQLLFAEPASEAPPVPAGAVCAPSCGHKPRWCRWCMSHHEWPQGLLQHRPL